MPIEINQEDALLRAKLHDFIKQRGITSTDDFTHNIAIVILEIKSTLNELCEALGVTPHDLARLSDGKKKMFSVWVGGIQINDYKLPLCTAVRIAQNFIEGDYGDVDIDIVTRRSLAA